MLVVPDTRFAVSRDGAHIAYQVVGEGKRDLVYVPNWASPIDLIWEQAAFRRFLERLTTFSRLILFDKRGSGASDHVAPDSLATLEAWSDDMVTVMDAVGSPRAAVVGAITGVPIVTLFAATHPQRTEALVLLNPTRSVVYGDPPGLGYEDLDGAMTAFKHIWGTPEVARILTPSMAGDTRFCSWLARFCRVGNPPSMATEVLRAQLLSDLRHVYSVIRAPTLIISRSDDGSGFLSSSHPRVLAEHIPGARLVEVPGVDLLPYVGETTTMLDEIESFLTGDKPNLVADRVLATVLFTDIVSSTQRAVDLGDRRWHGLLDIHHEDVRARIGHFGGRFIRSTGDGILATFDGPSRAIHCARTIREAAAGIGLQTRAGLHTGEVELMSDDIGGVAVHLAARVCSLAAAGEIWVSSSVPPLIVGSGIGFADRGEHELKGVPGRWTLLAAEVASRSAD
jgi:class 3 adenylate cyclase